MRSCGQSVILSSKETNQEKGSKMKLPVYLGSTTDYKHTIIISFEELAFCIPDLVRATVAKEWKPNRHYTVFELKELTTRVLNEYLRERCSKQFNIPVERMDGYILDKYDTENCVNIILEHIQIQVC